MSCYCINVDEIDEADFVAHYRAGVWSALGSGPAPTDGALNGIVRALAVDGADVYAVGDFTHIDGHVADKIARFDGSSWHAVGSSTFWGTTNVSLYGVAVDDGHVFVNGNFVNGGGRPLLDGIAAFDGRTWRNVGTNEDGTNGPTDGMRVLQVVGNRLYTGGFDPTIGGDGDIEFAAFYRLHQPDALISGPTGPFVGNDLYNTNAAGQARQLNVAHGGTGTFRIQVFNEGWDSEDIKLRGPSSGAGFTATYRAGAADITAQVVAGTYTIPNLAPGRARTITLRVEVGHSVAANATRAWLVTASTTGPGPARDAVRAIVRAN